MQLSKYNASGNDFVIFHTFKSMDRKELAMRLCDRYNSIGADGLIVILPSKECDFEWEFYNSDGSLASMCGNGSRAAALYAYQNSLCSTNCSFKTGAGIIKANINNDFVEVALTAPKKLSEPFSECGFEWSFYDTGVPHLVTFVDDFSKFDLRVCSELRKKYNANVNFAHLKENGVLEVRTFERGVENETNACGTGMAASFYTGVDRFKFDTSLKVNPKSKEDLWLKFDGTTIYFKGKVKHCFDTSIS
ncbi:diaminopimelate epimerase [Campylobacter fetus]|uniref:diaminopimelate epimerase n=1 Tax=Campylobacter fetus TaxID=196 RepID=UPI00081882EA|nr:diaminopimelate epimerase [Campylobacter fetus]OCR85163.1 diaminopimelate epimerase [Campylobacter fetus subsp. testudinum]OCR94150.1 diaminopimelate epimerase [Campylobacter fetus subsp. testudinum]